MSIIQAAGSGEVSTGFYSHLLDQSLKFNDDDSQYLTRTPTTTGNRKTWTFSCWLKGASFGSSNTIWSTSQNYDSLRYTTTGKFMLLLGNTSANLQTTDLFRDPSAWNNLVVSVDTTQSTSTDRVKFYVNGSQITSFSTSTYPSQNYDTGYNHTSYVHAIGRRQSSSSLYWDCYLAEINMIDGTALDASSFGETKNGIWIPKSTSGLTFGTNGFHLTFKDDAVSEGFNTVTYSGNVQNGSAQSVSGVGFQPDFVWIKERSSTSGHMLQDSVRGATKNVQSSATSAEATSSSKVTSFDGDGFSLGTGGAVNANADTYVAWCWEAGGAPTADNSAGAGATPTAGSVKIDGSNLGSALAGSTAATRISANTSRGFSIVKYTGTGSNATVAHGLSSAPEMILIKELTSTSGWVVYASPLGAGKYLNLHSTAAEDSSTATFNDTAPTSSVFSVGTSGGTNQSSEDYIAYCFHSVTGYSKISSYSGSGSSGKTVACGFAPAFVMIKRSSGTSDWTIFDNTRDAAYDGTNNRLWANLTTAESTTANYLEFTSTGFTLKAGDNAINASSSTYVYMAFADTREAAFFKDVSTNGNHFTPINLDYRDSVPDTPTNNFATMNPLDKNSMTLVEGNLRPTPTGDYKGIRGNFAIPLTGKWFFEARVTTGGGGNITDQFIGIATDQNVLSGSSPYPQAATYGVLYKMAGTIGRLGSNAETGLASFAAGDVLGVAINSTDNEVQFYKNGSTVGSAVALPSTTRESFAFFAGATSRSSIFNFGQDSTFAGAVSAGSATDGVGTFQSLPTDFKALCTANLDDPAIIDGSENFNTVLWTGNGSDGRSITGVGFDPDFVWIKSRNLTTSHLLNDTVRGANKSLFSEGTTAETANNGGGYLSAFVTDGFSVTSGSSGDDAVNDGSDTYVSWNWLAGTAFSNDASATSVGTIDSEGQVNTTAGFSIISYTGTGSAGTIKHGLSAAPEMLIIKERNATSQWVVGHHNLDASAPFDKGLYLDDTRAVYDDASNFNDTAPTSTVFSVGTGGYVNDSSNTYICYAFHSVEGYSKVGTYTGNNNADGTFVYTGFRPAWVMVKAYSTGGTHYDWPIYDSVRSPTNAIGAVLEANQSQAEVTGTGRGLPIDFLSNGFKFRSSYGESNAAQSYVYLAFAEQPLKFANAR